MRYSPRRRRTCARRRFWNVRLSGCRHVALRELGPDLAAVSRRLSPMAPAALAEGGVAFPPGRGAGGGGGELSKEIAACSRGCGVLPDGWRWSIVSACRAIDHILACVRLRSRMSDVRGHQARENVGEKMRGLVRRIQNRGYATLGRIADISIGCRQNTQATRRTRPSRRSTRQPDDRPRLEGPEFPVVFLVNVARGVVARRQPIGVLVNPRGDETTSPSKGSSPRRTRSSPERREEFKRLLYVALTRARDTLMFLLRCSKGVRSSHRARVGGVMPPSMTVLFEAAGTIRSRSTLAWTAPAGMPTPP